MYQVILINGVDDTKKVLYENDYNSCHNYMRDFAKKNNMEMNYTELETFAEKIIKRTENCTFYLYVIIDKKIDKKNSLTSL